MGQRFEIPGLGDLGKRAQETTEEIRKSRQLLTTSTHQLQQYLYEMNSMNQGDEDVSTLEIYMWFVAKEKAIYNALNMMKSSSNTYIASIWVPVEYESCFRDRISNFYTTEFDKWSTNENKERKIMPPTYFK